MPSQQTSGRPRRDASVDTDEFLLNEYLANRMMTAWCGLKRQARRRAKTRADAVAISWLLNAMPITQRLISTTLNTMFDTFPEPMRKQIPYSHGTAGAAAKWGAFAAARGICTASLNRRQRDAARSWVGSMVDGLADHLADAIEESWGSPARDRAAQARAALASQMAQGLSANLAAGGRWASKMAGQAAVNTQMGIQWLQDRFSQEAARREAARQAAGTSKREARARGQAWGQREERERNTSPWGDMGEYSGARQERHYKTYVNPYTRMRGGKVEQVRGYRIKTPGGRRAWA